MLPWAGFLSSDRSLLTFVIEPALVSLSLLGWLVLRPHSSFSCFLSFSGLPGKCPQVSGFLFQTWWPRVELIIFLSYRLPWSPCQDWTRISTAPPTSSVSAKSEWLAELEFANYGASGMFWLFKLNSVWNKWKITTMHSSFKPEFPYDYSKWEPIGSHPFYSKHMPFNTLCSLSGSTLVSYWSPTRHFPFFSFLLFKKLLLAQTL